MDALSHSLVAWMLFTTAGLIPLLPFAILGAVVPDADIFFSFISDEYPSLYLFTHGGIAHSFTGALILTVLSWGVIICIARAGIIPVQVGVESGVYGFAAVLSGTLLHLGIDVQACPGIPLLAPCSDRKYTIGILPGPSILLACAALGLVLVTVIRLLEFSCASAIYAAVVVLYLAVRVVFFLFASTRLQGQKVPKVNPFRWLSISKDPDHCTLQEYSLVRGVIHESVFPRYKLTDAEGVKAALRLPEVRRLFYHSYYVTAERIGREFVFSDPLRENGYLYYPPYYKRVTIPVGSQS